MSDVTSDAWLWASKGAGAVAGSAISLAYILPHESREAALRFAVGVVTGLVFGTTVGVKIASEMNILQLLSSNEVSLMGAAVASLCAWWALGVFVRIIARYGGKNDPSSDQQKGPEKQ